MKSRIYSFFFLSYLPHDYVSSHKINRIFHLKKDKQEVSLLFLFLTHKINVAINKGQKAYHLTNFYINGPRKGSKGLVSSINYLTFGYFLIITSFFSSPLSPPGEGERKSNTPYTGMDLAIVNHDHHIWNHVFNFLHSMAMKCAIQLGIPDAIERHGQPMTLAELANALDIHPTKATSLYSLMRLLCNSNFFSKQKPTNGDHQEVFSLTINSKLLLKNHPLSQAPFAIALLSSDWTEQAHFLGSWFQNDDHTPFFTLHGMSVWEDTSLAPQLKDCFQKAMESDCHLVASLLLNDSEFIGLFEGTKSMVDVGGGTGTLAKAIAKVFPTLKCTVLDLPYVVEGLQGNGLNLEFVEGNMFEAIPHADNLLLKWILHDWNDDDCIRILKRCKEAIPSREKGGKVIIIDMVVEAQNDSAKDSNIITQLLFDMAMVTFTGGKQRTENEWKNLFNQAGFDDYRILPILGSRSVIVVYPC